MKTGGRSMVGKLRTTGRASGVPKLRADSAASTVEDAEDIADSLSAIERARTEAPVPWKQTKARLKLS